MTRITNRGAIGSTFQALDTRMNEADAYANVRDLQTLRLNHNTLLAERVRRPVLAMTYGLTGGTAYDTVEVGPGSLTAESMPILVSTVLLFSQQTKSCTIKIRAASSTASQDVYLYPQLFNIHEERPLDTSVSLTNTVGNPVTGTTEDWYSASVPLPFQSEEGARHGMRPIRFRLYGRSQLFFGSPTVTGGVVHDNGPMWLDGDTNVTIGHDIWFTNQDFERRRIVDVVDNQANSNTIYRIYVDRPWGDITPKSKGVTYSTVAGSKLRLYTMSIYEDNVTDFESTPGAI